MLNYPNINPVAISIGVIKIHWYGIMYFIGLLIAFLIARSRSKLTRFKFFSGKQVLDDLLSYSVLGVIIGGRLGFCVLYRPEFYFYHPLEIIKIWEGGMAFHGGMLGVFVSTYLFAYKYKKSFFFISDFIAPLVPIGLLTGRIGNFINGELYGKACDHIQLWCMKFPHSDELLRHPSQMYEAMTEGLLLFIILNIYNLKPRHTGQTSALFLIYYAIIRCCLELFRQPDNYHYAQTIYHYTGLSLGQVYCIPMFMAGILIYALASKRYFST